MRLFNFFKKSESSTITKYKMMTDRGNGYYSWNGKLYQSDIVRSAIRPKVRAIGKAVAKHIRTTVDGEGNTTLNVNPEAYIKFLLKEPNAFMSGQMFQEKMATQLELNSNAFAFIQKDENRIPIAMYPIVASQAEMLQSNTGELIIKFMMINGTQFVFRYSDVIHLRKDFNENDYFGESIAESIAPLMEVINTTDQGIVKAIKNSNVVRWLLKYNQSLRPEDIEKNTKKFIDTYLSTEAETVGAAGTDAKADITQVEPKDYVPNEKQTAYTKERIYSLFNTNEKIVQSSYNEDEWVSYYESQVEPELLQLSDQFTFRLFTRRERAFGNEIIFESSSLTFASMQTKLQLLGAVDRGAMTRNEWRRFMNMAPVPGGDELIMRLDTQPINLERREKDD